MEKGYAEAEDVGRQLRYTLRSPPGEEAEETEYLLHRLAPEDLNALKIARAMVDDELERLQRQLPLLETLTDDEEDGP